MGAQEVHKFISSLRRHESNGRYDYTDADSDRRGAYGITPENWRRWTTELGLTGAPWQSKQAQDMVAREKALQLYSRYGDWKLVALAWWGGTDLADDAATRGADPSIPMMGEAAKVASGLGSAPTRTAVVSPVDEPQPLASEPQAETELVKAMRATGRMPEVRDPKQNEMHHLIAPILQGLSNAERNAAARGAGIPNGDPEGSRPESAGVDGIPDSAEDV